MQRTHPPKDSMWREGQAFTQSPKRRPPTWTPETQRRESSQTSARRFLRRGSQAGRRLFPGCGLCQCGDPPSRPTAGSPHWGQQQQRCGLAGSCGPHQRILLVLQANAVSTMVARHLRWRQQPAQAEAAAVGLGGCRRNHCGLSSWSFSSLLINQGG